LKFGINLTIFAPWLPWQRPFIKLCRNIHHSVWQLLGSEKIQNGSRCHGNQGAKMLNSLQTSQIFAVIFPVTSTSRIFLQSLMKFDESNPNFF
jgi:hypothetical protein